MAQVAETHIDTLKSLQTKLEHYIPLPNNVLKLLGPMFDHMCVKMCLYHLGSSGTNL